MDLLWKQHLGNPQAPGLYKISGSAETVWVRQDDIDNSKLFNGDDIRCSCVPHFTDPNGNQVYQIFTLRDLIPKFEDAAHGELPSREMGS